MNWKSLLFPLSVIFISGCGTVDPSVHKEKSRDSTTNYVDTVTQDGLNIYPLPAGEHIAITNARPSKNDSSVFLCIAGAFTRLDNNTIDGLYIVDGKVVNDAVTHKLGGALITSENGTQMMGTDDGTLLSGKWIDSVCALHRSVLQQIQLVRNGNKLDFHNAKDRFQCRAVVIFSDGKMAVVESTGNLTLDEFAQKLLDHEVKDAIYCDMGGWDEGWYRNAKNGGIITIGTSRLSTERQSNWLIFKY